MSTRRLPVAALPFVSALVWWAVGYLPWQLTGLGAGLGEVSVTSTTTDGITIPLLPSQLPVLVLGALVGGACAGLLALLADGRAGATLAASFAGVACAVLLTGVQSSSAVRAGGGSTYVADESMISALLATTAGASLLGWLLGAGAYFGRVPLGIAMAGLAGALPVWLGYLVFAIDADIRSGLVFDAINYAGAALLTAGLVVIGVRPYSRLLAWPAAIALAWIVQPAFTATGYLGGALRPPAELSEALGPTWDVFTIAVRPANTPAAWGVPFVVAIGLALAISIRLEMRRESFAPAAEAVDHSPVEPSSSSRTTST